MKNRKRKEFIVIDHPKKEVRFIIFVSVLMCSTILTVSILLAACTPYINQKYLFNHLIYFVSERSFEKVADSWRQDDVVKSVSYICSFYTNNYSKVYCAYDMIARLFAESPEAERYFNILAESPEKVLLNGGVCRDIATLYKSIYDEMGIRNEFVTMDYKNGIFAETGHIYNKIYVNGDYVYINVYYFCTEEDIEDCHIYDR